jgi:hypothetical protein
MSTKKVPSTTVSSLPVSTLESQVEVTTENSAPVQRKKRELTEKQKETLQKGRSKIQELSKKRNQILERNKLREAKRLLGQECDSSDEEVPAGLSKGTPKKKKEPIPDPPPSIHKKIRKDRGLPKEPIMRRKDMEDFMTLIDAKLSKLSIPEPVERIVEVPVEKIVEKPVERIVIKERRLSGSNLLDKIFFNKDHF